METNQMAQPVQTPPPTPGTPNRKRNIAFAGIVMLMLASGAAYGYFTKAPTPPGTKPAIA